MEETGNSINRFLITFASFSRELNTARNRVDIAGAIEKVLGRFFKLEACLSAAYDGVKWDVFKKDEGFPFDEEEMKSFYDLALERKSPSFFPLETNGFLVILPAVKSGKLLSSFFGYIENEDDDEFTQELETSLGFFSYYSGIVLENLRLFGEVRESARLQEELRKYFEKMLNSLDEGICVLDASGGFVFKNQKFDELELEEEIIEEIKAISSETLDQSAGQAREKEFNQGFFSFNSIVLAGGGEILVRLEDISNTKELERMKQIDQMKTEFIANISHELRTPLSAITAYSETITESLESLDAETLKEFMGTILDQSNHLTFLLDQLLDFSRMERKNLQIDKSRFNIVALIKRAKESTRELYERFNTKIEINADNDEMFVEGDEKRIHQVLINLISNAIKYGDKEEEERNVILTVAEVEDSEEIRISIDDNGVGIDEENLEKIFEKFYRIDSSLTYEVEGTGLGLAICREILLEHGKDIHVTSKVGEGSHFEFKLDKAKE